MPTSTINRTGMREAMGLLVDTAGKNCTIVLNVKKHTTTFLYCKKSAMGMKVRGVKRVDLTLLEGASRCC